MQCSQRTTLSLSLSLSLLRGYIDTCNPHGKCESPKGISTLTLLSLHTSTWQEQSQEEVVEEEEEEEEDEERETNKKKENNNKKKKEKKKKKQKCGPVEPCP